MSGKTAQQSAFCVQIMDALDKLGKTIEAHQVRQLLKKNVAKAYRVAKELEPLTKPSEPKPLVAVSKQQKYLTRRIARDKPEILEAMKQGNSRA